MKKLFVGALALFSFCTVFAASSLPHHSEFALPKLGGQADTNALNVTKIDQRDAASPQVATVTKVVQTAKPQVQAATTAATTGAFAQRANDMVATVA